MIDLDYLSKLISVLSTSNVKHIKMAGLELTLESLSPLILSGPGQPPNTTDQILEALKLQEDKLPPDLRTDAITDYDKVLNWSGSPQEEDTQMPLTGDRPLNEEAI